MSKIFPNQIVRQLETTSMEAVLVKLNSAFASEGSWLAKNAELQRTREENVLIICPKNTGQTVGQPKIKLVLEKNKVDLITLPAKSIWLMPSILVIMVTIAVIWSGSWFFILFLPLGMLFFYLMQWVFFSMNLARANEAMDELIRALK